MQKWKKLIFYNEQLKFVAAVLQIQCWMMLYGLLKAVSQQHTLRLIHRLKRQDWLATTANNHANCFQHKYSKW